MVEVCWVLYLGGDGGGGLGRLGGGGDGAAGGGGGLGISTGTTAGGLAPCLQRSGLTKNDLVPI
jgi:hypothetical protein